MWDLSAVSSGGMTHPQDEQLGGVCFHDTYSYDGLTRRAVKHYNPRKKVFTVYPHTFCSVNCAKRFLFDRNQHQQASLMLMFAKRYYNYDKSFIVPAPARDLLQPYLSESQGGMDIATFRAMSTEGYVSATSFPPYFVAPLMQWKRKIYSKFEPTRSKKNEEHELDEEMEHEKYVNKRTNSPKIKQVKSQAKTYKGVRGRLDAYLRKYEKHR
jgi:hypothetical protein